MKIFIHANSHRLPHNHNCFRAYEGFSEMGFETVFFRSLSDIEDTSKEDILVGYVGSTRRRLAQFGITPPELDYPAELQGYLGREICTGKLSEIANNPARWPIFVKPVEDKLFTGVVVRSTKDLVGCGSCGNDPDVFISPVVDFVAEWRCFVRYGRVLDVRPYLGNWRAHFDANIIEKAVTDYTTAPAGYAMDFGLTVDGRTLLLEVNDGYSLGCYGLNAIAYAKLLSARWAELTGTTDECAFDQW